MDGTEADGVAPTSPEGDTVGEALECGVLPRCGVLLVVVGAGRVGFVVGVVVGVGLGAYVVGVTVGAVPVPDVEELAGTGLTSSQAARLTTKITMRTQVEVRTSRSRRISRSRPVRSAFRSPARSAG